jgi:hypothetical protein
MFVVNNAGINGTLHGGFAKIRVDRIINHTRYDPRNELRFNPLAIGDEINVAYGVAGISIGDKISGNIERGVDYGMWVVRKYDIL